MHPHPRRFIARDGREYHTWVSLRAFPGAAEQDWAQILYLVPVEGGPLRMIYLDFATTTNELCQEDLEALFAQAQRI